MKLLSNFAAFKCESEGPGDVGTLEFNVYIRPALFSKNGNTTKVP